jgi:hypothetical protein
MELLYRVAKLLGQILTSHFYLLLNQILITVIPIENKPSDC